MIKKNVSSFCCLGTSTKEIILPSSFQTTHFCSPPLSLLNSGHERVTTKPATPELGPIPVQPLALKLWLCSLFALPLSHLWYPTAVVPASSSSSTLAAAATPLQKRIIVNTVSSFNPNIKTPPRGGIPMPTFRYKFAARDNKLVVANKEEPTCQKGKRKERIARV